MIAVSMRTILIGDPPPANWSTLRYVFGHEKEDGYAEEETDT